MKKLNKHPIHVLILPSWYPEHKDHYMGSFFREQAIGIHKNGCKVGVIYPELKSLRNTYDIRILPRVLSFNDNGINTLKFKWSNWAIGVKYLQIELFKFIGHYLFKLYLKKNGTPDIIHCQSIFNAGFLAEFISEKYKIPYIITEHNSGFYYHNQGFKKFYSSVSRILNNSKKCFAVSKNYSNYLSQEISINKNWGVHYNIVNDNFLNTKIKKPPLNDFTFLCVSRLHKIKNIDLIIDSFKIFNQKYTNSSLKIIGIGDQLKSLKKKVKDYKLTNKILFKGEKSRIDIIEEFNQSHAFIYASAFETFGVIFVESMSMGRPIISLDCGSAREIISELSGIIVEKKSAQDMSSSMEELYNNYSKYNSYSIRKYCESNFSEKKLSVKMIGHYIDVLNNR